MTSAEQPSSESRHIARYAGNPLIARLPPEEISQEALEVLLSHLPDPPTNKDRAEKSARERMFDCEDIRNVQVCLERDFELEADIATVIREGYRDRLPSASYWRKHSEEVQRILENAHSSEPDVTQVRAIALTGISGGGKSRTVTKIMQMYPQLVPHDTRANPKLPLKQVVWLKVDYPSNRSMGGFCVRFLEHLGKLVGEDYKKEYGGGSVDEMISDIGALARLHWLGILIIDEVQHAVGKSGKASDSLLRHLISLSNELKMPLMLIGTPKATREMRLRLAAARRLIGRHFDRFAKHDENWVLLVTQLWDYQYTKFYVEADTAIFDKLYDLTQGIPAFLTALWVLTQRRGILAGLREGTEVPVSVTALQEVYDAYFGAVDPVIQAIQSKNDQAMEAFEDVASTFRLDDLLTRQNEQFEAEIAKMGRAISNTGRTVRKRIKQRFNAFLVSSGEKMAAAKTDDLAQQMKKAIADGKDPNEVLQGRGYFKSS